jgi:hypothetical protein
MHELPMLLNTTTRITRIDIALDIPGVRLADVAVRVAHAQILTPFSRSGTLKSLYFGNPKSPHQIVAYDKADEVAEKNGLPQPLQPILRIETRIKAFGGKARRFSELLDHENPFEDIFIVCLDQLAPHLPNPERLFFLDSVRYRGVQAALKVVPKSQRQHYWPSSLPAPDWWSPKGAWSQWPDVVNTRIYAPVQAGILAPGGPISSE